MSPSIVEAIAPRATSRSLAAKIECAILSVLVQCHGQFEISLQDWVSSLRLAFPDIENGSQVRDVFKQLCEEGVIRLHSPWIGEYSNDSSHTDFHFLALDEFTASLTARGVVRWDSIRRF